MPTQVASLYANIGAKTDEFEKGASKVKSQLTEISSTLSTNANKTAGFVSANQLLTSSLGGIVAAGGAYLKFMIDAQKEAADAEQTQAKLEAVYKSTGGTVGYTVSQLEMMATAMGRLNVIDDDVVKNGEAVLLTFTQIGKQTFPQTMQAAIDMSAVFGGDLQQSVIQVGKAMNDFSGYTALKRTGVSFTEEQMKQIDNFRSQNDLIGYQNLVLKELQKEFGGSAEKMAQASLGTQQLKVAMGDFKETVGKAEWLQNFNYGLAYTLNLTGELIGKMQDNHNEVESNIEAYARYAKNMGTTEEALYKSGLSLEVFSDNLRIARGMADRTKDDMYALASSVDTVTSSTNTYTSSNQDVIKTIMDLQRSNDDYKKSVEDVNASFADGTKVVEIYKQDKADLLKQAQQGIITWADYTTKVNDLTASYRDGTLATQEQKKAVDELAKQHEMDMKKMIFSMLEERAAAQGMSDGTMSALLDMGVKMGVIDQSSADMGKAFSQAMDDMTNAMSDPKSNITDINSKLNNMLKLTGMSYDYYVNIHTSGSFPNIPGQAGGGSTGGQHNKDIPAAAMASGGWLSGNWTLVGDRPGGGFVSGVSELISPWGYVYDSRTSERLIKSGLVDMYMSRALDETGGIGGGGGGGGGNMPPIYTYKPTPHHGGGRSSSGGSSDAVSVTTSDSTQAIVATTINTQQMVVTQMQLQLDRTTKSNALLAEKLDSLIMLATDNPKQVGDAVLFGMGKY